MRAINILVLFTARGKLMRLLKLYAARSLHQGQPKTIILIILKTIKFEKFYPTRWLKKFTTLTNVGYEFQFYMYYNYMYCNQFLSLKKSSTSQTNKLWLRKLRNLSEYKCLFINKKLNFSPVFEYTRRHYS